MCTVLQYVGVYFINGFNLQYLIIYFTQHNIAQYTNAFSSNKVCYTYSAMFKMFCFNNRNISILKFSETVIEQQIEFKFKRI